MPGTTTPWRTGLQIIVHIVQYLVNGLAIYNTSAFCSMAYYPKTRDIWGVSGLVY